MQTYTHFVLTAVINRVAKDREERLTPPAAQAAEARSRLPPVNSFWLMLGSIMPDIPLILITLIAIALDLIQGNPMEPGNAALEMQSYTGYLFRYAFFHEPWVKLAHNLFHAPFLILLYIFFGHWLWKQGKASSIKWGAALFWFGLACALHTSIDIPLHYDDGPLLFFPFDWETRFYSPISYWDPDRYGRPFSIFEHVSLLGMLIYLTFRWWLGRRQRRRTVATS